MTTAVSPTMKQTSSIKTLKPRKEKSRLSKKKMASQGVESSPIRGEPNSASSAARVKRFHSKSRKGCLTCRQRRVKCDEQRTPKCNRCSKGGYICEWQEPRTTRSRTVSNHLSPTTTRSPSQATLTSEDETFMPTFFTKNVVASVSTLFVDMSQSFIADDSRSHIVSNAVTTFYYQFVYNACQTSPIIRKTLNALTGLWEQAFLTSRNSSPRHHDYITRYSQVVTEFRTSSDELQPDIVLIASVLFANCEYLMGDLPLALRQLRAGAKYLQVHKHNQDGRLSPELLETLEVIFDGFNHNGIELDCSTPGSDYLDPATELPFDDLGCANDDLLQIYSHTFALNRVGLNHPAHITPAADDFRRWADLWKHRTIGLQETLDVEYTPWLDLLHGQHTALNTMLQDMSSTIDRPRTEEETLDDMVLQVSTFLQTCSASIQDPSLPSRPYQGNAGLILPLFMVILRCNDTEICETALSLLSRLHITEGEWNSCCAHAIARSVLSARYAMRDELTFTLYNMQDVLPVAQIKTATPLESGSEIELTVVFPQSGQNESSAIVGGFCTNKFSSMDKLCSAINSGGFQGPVIAGILDNCLCQDSV